MRIYAAVGMRVPRTEYADICRRLCNVNRVPRIEYADLCRRLCNVNRVPRIEYVMICKGYVGYREALCFKNLPYT